MEENVKAVFWSPVELKKLFKESIVELKGESLMAAKEPLQDVLNIQQASELICLSIPTIRKYTKSGTIKKLYPEVRKNLYLRNELLRFKQYYENR